MDKILSRHCNLTLAMHHEKHPECFKKSDFGVDNAGEWLYVSVDRASDFGSSGVREFQER